MASDPNVPPEEARLEDANQPAATDTAATDGDEAAEKNVGVVFVHGQGSDRHPGSEFAKLLNGLVIGLQGADREYEFTVDADEKVDGIAVPSATLVVSRPHGSPRRDRFRFREAFWDDAFPPPGADEVLRWVLYGFGQAMDGVFTGWWRDPSASGFEAKEPWWKPRIRKSSWGRMLFRIELILSF